MFPTLIRGISSHVLLYIEVSISFPRAADNSRYFLCGQRGRTAARVILSWGQRGRIARTQ